MIISPHVPLPFNWAYSSFFNTYFSFYVVKFIALFFYNLLLSASVLWKYSNFYKKFLEVCVSQFDLRFTWNIFFYIIWSKMKVKKWIDSLDLYITCQSWDKWGTASVPYLWRESLFNMLSQDFILLLTVSLASLI